MKSREDSSDVVVAPSGASGRVINNPRGRYDAVVDDQLIERQFRLALPGAVARNGVLRALVD